MAYTQPPFSTAFTQKISQTPRTGSAIYTGRFGISNSDYWGRFTIGGFPISFDSNITVDTALMFFPNFDMAFPGGAARIWVYEADANGMPRTRKIDAGVINDIGLTGPGTYGVGFSPVVLEKNKTYWVISQNVLYDGNGDVDITLEDFGNNNLRRVGEGTGWDPTHSGYWVDGGALAFSGGVNPVGLYIDELQSPGWTPATPAPATLTGDFEAGFYTTGTVGAVWLEGTPA